MHVGFLAACICRQEYFIKDQLTGEAPSFDLLKHWAAVAEMARPELSDGQIDLLSEGYDAYIAVRRVAVSPMLHACSCVWSCGWRW